MSEPRLNGWIHSLKKSVTKPLHLGAEVTPAQRSVNFDGDDKDSTEADVGPYAGETRMPSWLVKVLKNGDKITLRKAPTPDGVIQMMNLKTVETPGVVAALLQLLRVDSSVKRASLCSPNVHYVAKLRREGSFCGYRNIQMMVSYLCNTKTEGHEHFREHTLPSIFTLQQMIEEAWKRGFNSSGRDELGNIHMTRKFIGTSEVEAMFLSLDIPVTTEAFVPSPGVTAYESLVEYVSKYFDFDTHLVSGDQIAVTSKPPIFLQRQGHSMTIVGIEENTLRSRTLLVFDPRYQPSKAMKKLALNTAGISNPEKLVKPYRYGPAELATYDAFEIVQLSAHIA